MASWRGWNPINRSLSRNYHAPPARVTQPEAGVPAATHNHSISTQTAVRPAEEEGVKNSIPRSKRRPLGIALEATLDVKDEPSDQLSVTFSSSPPSTSAIESVEDNHYPQRSPSVKSGSHVSNDLYGIEPSRGHSVSPALTATSIKSGSTPAFTTSEAPVGQEGLLMTEPRSEAGSYVRDERSESILTTPSRHYKNAGIAVEIPAASSSIPFSSEMRAASPEVVSKLAQVTECLNQGAGSGTEFGQEVVRRSHRKRARSDQDEVLLRKTKSLQRCRAISTGETQLDSPEVPMSVVGIDRIEEVSSVVLSLFLLFPRLPEEIQFSIWEWAMEEAFQPRIHTILLRDKDWPLSEHKGVLRKFRSYQPIPPLVHVCRDSRRLAAEKFDLIYLFGTYIRPATDVFYLAQLYGAEDDMNRAYDILARVWGEFGMCMAHIALPQALYNELWAARNTRLSASNSMLQQLTDRCKSLIVVRGEGPESFRLKPADTWAVEFSLGSSEGFMDEVDEVQQQVNDFRLWNARLVPIHVQVLDRRDEGRDDVYHSFRHGRQTLDLTPDTGHYDIEYIMACTKSRPRIPGTKYRPFRVRYVVKYVGYPEPDIANPEYFVELSDAFSCRTAILEWHAQNPKAPAPTRHDWNMAKRQNPNWRNELR